jgi:hypothetical protein
MWRNLAGDWKSSILLLAFAFCIGCEPQRPLMDHPINAPVSAVSAPIGPLVYQPEFVWSSGKTTQQGTGFLVKRITGDVVGVTSAHFIDFQGPALLEARWLDMVTAEPLIVYKHAFGNPGRNPTLNPLDLRPDYFILHKEEFETDRPTLEFDYRPNPDHGERVWLPNKNSKALTGHDFVEGTIIEANQKHLTVLLDHRIETHSQSGSPFVSQKTGKVIGVFSATPVKKQGEIIYLAPAQVFLSAMRDAQNRPLLKDVVGQVSPNSPSSTAAEARAIADQKP